MPNRTIYVADADVAIFEKAQELAGENLSATITQALRRFVEAEEARASGFEEITVKVGKIAHSYKRFRGRLLAKGRVFEQNDTRRIVYEVYQTAKEKLALYVRSAPNWENPKTWSYEVNVDYPMDSDSSPNWENPPGRSTWSYRNWSHHDWSQWPNREYEFRLSVYETLDELKDNVPQELYEAVAQALKGEDGAEYLDI
jgi:EXLDI family protein